MTLDEKTERDVLKSPGQSALDGGSGPRVLQTPIEQQIAQAWESILGVTGVDVDDSFFDLGGNSLAVIRFLSWAMETYSVEIPLSSFFEQPTLAQTALLVAGLDTLPKDCALTQERMP